MPRGRMPTAVAALVATTTLLCVPLLAPVVCAKPTDFDVGAGGADLTLSFLEAAVQPAADIDNAAAGSVPKHTRGAAVVPTHKIWRLNVPGSASSNLYSAVQKGEKQSWRQRFGVCETTTTDDGDGDDGDRDCADESEVTLVLRGCHPRDFRARASFLRTAQQSQHADYHHLHDRFIPKHLRPGQRLLALTMVRDPFDHFIRSFDKKARAAGATEKSFLFAPTWRERGVGSIDVPDDQVPLSEFAEKAFWRWNIFTRSLASNFSGGHILNGRMKNDNITRAQAEAINRAAVDGPGAGADVLELAKRRLLNMSFFGMFERLQDSMELLAHTMCWDYDDLGFVPQNRRHKQTAKSLSVRPDGQPEDTEHTRTLVERNNAADRVLHVIAMEVFDERVRQMRADRAAGIACRLLDTGCYVERHTSDGGTGVGRAGRHGGGGGGEL